MRMVKMLQKTQGLGTPGGVRDFLWHKERRLLVLQASSQPHEEGQRTPCHLPSIADSMHGTAGSRQPPEISSTKQNGAPDKSTDSPVFCHQALIKENTTGTPVTSGNRFPAPHPPPPHSQHQDEREGVKWEDFRREN